MEDDGLLYLEPRDLYDPCIVGVGRRFHDTFLIYDIDKIIEALTKDGVEGGADYDEAREDAREHFEFNVIGGWVGNATPGFVSMEEPF
jgi:hypothetical protein